MGLLLTAAMFMPSVAVAQDSQTYAALENKLSQQYGAIQRQFRNLPPPVLDAVSRRADISQWQDELARLFSEAALTVEEILKLNPSNAALWRERLETLRLYGKPTSPPGLRTIYGASEVDKKAKLVDTPVAVYTEEARQADARDEVRLRLVLAGDGTIRNMFPIKSAGHALTESAVTAAQQIKFEPAVKDGRPVSQFVTLVYDFKKKDAKPKIPRTVF
ncbi:MAG TPA: TonB family protein [Pyrinomonadaceae bacterium]|nr:TonB family protein [Pyrinomonadaceae bacterium]